MVVLLVLGGCTAYTNTALQAGAALEDQVLDTAVTVKCKAASVGSIMRRYGQNFKVWTDECVPNAIVVPQELGSGSAGGS